MNRLPAEIWEDILDWVIDIPFFFDLECTLDDFYDWTAKQIEISLGAVELYAYSEKQRRALRPVCHSWKAFAESRADRWAYRKHVPARSLHVSVDDATEEHYTQETRWEMVGLRCSLHPTTGEYGAPILRLAENHERHTKIQRISLQSHSSWVSSELSNPLLSSLAAFSNLRTLRLDITILQVPPRPITLSRLTNLRWVCGSLGRRPHECLILPSVIFLGVSITGYTHDPAALVAPYQCTLKHLILGYEQLIQAGGKHWTLPPWESYPHLVELAIDTIRTPVPSVPSPPTLGHPLSTFRIPRWDSRSIKVVLGDEGHRNHIKSITVTRLRWRKSVVLPTDHVGVVEDHHLEKDIRSIIKLCSERGVRLEDGLHQTIQDSDPTSLDWYQGVRLSNDLVLWHNADTCADIASK